MPSSDHRSQAISAPPESPPTAAADSAAPSQPTARNPRALGWILLLILPLAWVVRGTLNAPDAAVNSATATLGRREGRLDKALWRFVAFAAIQLAP